MTIRGKHTYYRHVLKGKLRFDFSGETISAKIFRDLTIGFREDNFEAVINTVLVCFTDLRFSNFDILFLKQWFELYRLF